MPLTPSLQQTLATDCAQGVWHPVSARFWDTTLRSVPGLAPTPGLLQALRRALSSGVWPPVVVATLQHVFPTATPGVLRTLQHELQRGQWGPVTVRTLERL